MEIRNLTTFVKIAEMRNFSRSAESLGYSQSAVTMQIKQLEEELGVPLFERFGKRVKLTPAGERLLPYAIQVLNSVQMAENSVSEAGENNGRVRIGTCESYVISILPEVFIAFGQKYPKAEISTHTAETEELFTMLRRNDVDLLYFLDRKVYFPDWVKVFERPVKIHFVASPENRLAKEKNIPIDRLLEEPLLLTEKGISYRYAMEQVLAERGFELHPFLEVGNTDIINRFVSENRGISFLPEYVISDYLKKGSLVILDADCPEIVMWSQLVYHRNKFLTPQVRHLIEMIESCGENA